MKHIKNFSNYIEESIKTETNIKLCNDFYNKVATELHDKYFPTVKYYRDDKNETKARYALELFNNGVLTYSKLIKRISDSCSDTQENIHEIVSKYVEDFAGFEFKP